MKKVIIILLCISVVFIVKLNSNLHAKTNIILACENTEQFPYFIGKSLKIKKINPGITIEILQLVGKRLNINIVFQRYPWKRCLNNLKHNIVDGIFNSSFKKERLVMGKYPMKNGKVDKSRKIEVRKYIIYKHLKSKVTWDGKNLILPGNKISAVLGYSIISDLEKKGLTVIEGRNTLMNLLNVQNRNISATAELASSSKFIIQKHKSKLPDIVEVKPPLKVKPYYLMLSHKFVKSNPKLAKKIWNEIRNIRNSVDYQNIKKKYYK